MWSHVLLLTFLPAAVFSANILFYHGVHSSKSHNVGMVPIMEGLVAQGHNVTLFSPYPFDGNAKVHYVCPKVLKDENKAVLDFFGSLGLLNRLKTNAKELVYSWFDEVVKMCARVAHSPETMDWVRSSKYDLVVVDTFYNEFVYAAAYYWNAKVISYQSCATLFPWEHSIFNLPDEFSWMPQFDTTPTPHYGFFERLYTQIQTYIVFWKYESIYLPQVEQYSRDLLGLPEMPPLVDLVRDNTELIFVNFDSWNQFPRPLPPFVVSVSGSRFNKSRTVAPLPKDIQSWLGTGASQDFVYISFGSVVNIRAMPKDSADMFFAALRQLPVKVLLKWDGEVPKDLPSNVLTRKWFPQLDVLGHKHIRAYVLQGGQNSFQEAVLSGVPTIVLPLFGEQDLTARFVRLQGLGKYIEWHELTTELFRDSIIEVVSDPKYKKKVQQMQKAFFESPTDPTQNALMWIQRVLRGDDLSYLKPPSIGQKWWTYRLLDTLLLTFVSILLVPVVILGLIISTIKKIFKGSGPSRSEASKVKRDKKVKKN